MARLLSSVLLLLGCIHVCDGQICKFHHLNADCHYRIDGFCLAHITVTVNQCDDPISLTLLIECQNPAVHWTAVYEKLYERRIVDGFDAKVFVIVNQGYTEANKYHIDIDFISEMDGKKHFMDEDLNLITEGCVTLNDPAKVAVGILVPLVILATVALVVVIMIRRRQLKNARLNETMLVDNLETADRSVAPVANTNEDTDTTQASPSSDSTDRDDTVVFSQISDTHTENPTC